MVKVTPDQIAKLDKLLDSPQDLQKLGAAVVHTMKQQIKAGVDTKEIRMPLVTAEPVRGAVVEDSIDVSANDVVSVGWSHDIGSMQRNQMNEKIRGVAPAEQVKMINTLIPKGLETGKRIKLVR